MKTMLIAFIAIGLIGFGMHEGLKRAGFSSAEMTSGPNVRLDSERLAAD